MKINVTALCASLVLLLANASQATSVGYSDPAWSNDTVFWDTFASVPGTFGGTVSFANVGMNLSVTAGAPNAPGNGFPGMQLDKGFETAVGDVIYTGGVNTSWSLSGVAASTITTVSFQIKEQSGSDLNVGTYFSPKINGSFDPIEVNIVTGLIEGYTEQPDPENPDQTILVPYKYNIITYTWEGLNILAGQSLNINFTGTGGTGPTGSHRALDGFRVDTDGTLAVPEPSTWVLLGLGGLFSVWMIKLRRSVNA
jgi:hypothetical protein